MDLNNINVGDLKEKLKAIDKKTLIKFGIGIGNFIIFDRVLLDLKSNSKK